jgi:hypothetical protein
MAAVGGYEVGFDKVRALLSWASTVQSFDSWSAERIATAVGPDLALSVELEHYGQHADGENKQMTLRAHRSTGARKASGRSSIGMATFSLLSR